MSKDVKKSKRCQICPKNCKLNFICHKMSNVKKSNTLTVDDLKEMSNIKMSRSQKDVNKLLIYMRWPGVGGVRWPWLGGVRWPWVRRVRWPGLGGVRWPVVGGLRWPGVKWPGVGGVRWHRLGEVRWPGVGWPGVGWPGVGWPGVKVV